MMENKSPPVCNHLNILGASSVILAIIFLCVFLNIKDSHESMYFLGALFTCLILVILSFGFSKIFDLLYQIQQKLE
jgi:hypothetical protein